MDFVTNDIYRKPINAEIKDGNVSPKGERVVLKLFVG